MTPLDRPAWFSLSQHHAHMALTAGQVRRFPGDVNAFIATASDAPGAWDGASGLVGDAEEVFVVQSGPSPSPPGLALVKSAEVLQFVAGADMPEGLCEDDVTPLGDSDAPDMLALALQTQPGPFRARTHAMGQFIGVRVDGRLAAMAGERFRFEGHTEISGVCTHPDFRGQGLARRLSAIVCRRIMQRGETPFLHSWSTNEAANALYAGLGFHLRCAVTASIFQKA